MTNIRMEEEVSKALKKLSAQDNPKDTLFRIHYSAEQVAKEAKVTTTTARRWLNYLMQYRGYRRRKIGATFGYRYDEKEW